MTIEAGVVVGLDGEEALHWHLPPNRTVVALPDSRHLWDVLWENRKRMSGVAHSHPGFGRPGPSWEDITTFQGVESGMGRRFKWWIASMDQLVVVEWVGPHPYGYKVTSVQNEPSWVHELRRLSRTESTRDAEEDEHDSGARG